MKKYLRYIKNTNGHATKAAFIEDWEPIGNMVWNDLLNADLATLNMTGYVVLTPKGEAKLEEN